MSRNKYPEVTVQKILEVSAALFLEKGYQNTSMQDIVTHLQMSKGAIYHHFKSKQELFEKVAEYYFNNVDWFHAIGHDESLNGLEKLRAVFLHELQNDEKIKMDHMAKHMFKNGAVAMEQLKSGIYDVAPMVSSLLKEGIQDGSIHTDFPLEISQVMILLTNFWINPCIFLDSKEVYLNKINFLRQMLEKMGIDFWNEELMQACNEYYDKIKK